MIKQIKYYSIIRISLLVKLILMISGCNKIIDWGKQNFKQGHNFSKSLISGMQSLIRSTIIYNDFMTIAQFDAIILTDEFCEMYASYYSKNHSTPKESFLAMKNKMLDKNKEYISFYIVGSQAENTYINNRSLFIGQYQKNHEMFADKNGQWQIRMHIENDIIAPESIRIVELPVEMERVFGIKYSQFKSVYFVKFPIKNQNVIRLLYAKQPHDISLIFKNGLYESSILWKNILYFFN